MVKVERFSIHTFDIQLGSESHEKHSFEKFWVLFDNSSKFNSDIYFQKKNIDNHHFKRMFTSLSSYQQRQLFK